MSKPRPKFLVKHFIFPFAAMRHRSQPHEHWSELTFADFLNEIMDAGESKHDIRRRKEIEGRRQAQME